MSRELKRFLFDRYGGFANKKLKDVERDEAFQIDDFGPEDRYHLCCHIQLRVNGDNAFELSLENIPTNRELSELIALRGPNIADGDFGTNISLQLNLADIGFLRDLARVVRRITRRGQRYNNPNWKWVCRRTGESLERLARYLEAYQRRRPAIPDEDDLFALLREE
ncbi:MAG: hypothetical protein DWQ35_13835 [Planctomycetota bacterium]|nr:MAG: hypothetical protein DWQ35_13835 [Planctomycetota bacterium]REK25977.1 MAG: hypothetical protein DWQ42_10125 [Planctomycetota bacterium]REK46908.1 MAG: hypothetical protein DWQ46_05280 [Planctomycetota bacterium]